MSAVGLIGVGRLGSAIAIRLLAAGFQLLGCDPLEDRRFWLESQGGIGATAYEIALRCRRVIFCLPDHETVRQVLPYLRPGTIAIDLTNAQPDQSEKAAVELRSRGIAYLDAPMCDWHETVRDRGGKESAAAKQMLSLHAGIFSIPSRDL